MPAQYIGDMDFSRLHFSQLIVENQRKRVDIFLTPDTNRRGFQFQLCKDEDSPVETRYNLDTPPEGGDPTRRGLSVKVEEAAARAQLREIDAQVLKAAAANSKEWFKRELTVDQLKLNYKFTVPEDDDAPSLMKFKIKCSGAKVPTKILRRVSDTQVLATTEKDLEAQGATIVPIVSTIGLWFMAGGMFGITFQAEDVLVVSTGKPATAVSNFALKRTLDVVEADPAPSGGVTLEGDDGPECKKAKAESPLEEEEDAPPAM